MLLGCALAAGLGVVALVLGWRGADWPAQLYRVDLFRRVGFTQWDNQWYGGHHTPGYSLLLPPLGALFGVRAVGVVSGVVATAAFAALVYRRLPVPALAVVVFGIGTVSNLVVGRITFALGLAIGMVAVCAMAAGWARSAVVLAVATPLASPVAGVFLAIGGTAYGLALRPIRRVGLVVAVAATAPVLALAVSFPEGGRFPFLFADLLVTAGIAAAAVWLLPRSYRTLRLGAALYALCAAVLFLAPNPLGGNFSRLAVYVAPPVAASLLWAARPVIAVPVVIALGLWQWQPAFDGMTAARSDPSLQPSYYSGLLDAVSGLPPTRIEIPFTRRHWEAARVAPHVALARGWERQLDIGLNPLFYSPSLDVATYRKWLVDNAIGYVAMPDAELDESAVAEADLLNRGVPGLQLIWQDAHWRMWRVSDARPLVDGPAHMERLDPNSFSLSVDAPSDLLVRVRYSSHWDIEGAGCVAPSPEGWTLVRSPHSGVVRVRQVVSRWIPFRPARPDTCPGGSA
jgi:hypothetical protein